MNRILALLTFSILLNSCSRRTIPSTTSTSANTTNTGNKTSTSNKADSSITTGTTKETKAYIPPIKTAIPKSITVNDKAATRTADGRYYYDLEGKRYWRNKKDGKYYLYYKGMFENKNFQ